jgi:anthranilate phosphoribosyltransferase
VTSVFTPSSSTPLAAALRCLADGTPLGAAETAAAFDVVMNGGASPAQTAALLMGLRARGESVGQLAGAATALRRAMLTLPTRAAERLVDTCGTGGGAVGTLNVSTAAAFVVAGAGVPVAKHGNRSYTSRCGSADVLEALGVDITLAPERSAELLEQLGFAFLFAPAYHPAMRHVGPTRKELGIATIMNLLGPLANPAGVQRQVIGVADPERGPLMAGALRALGATHALVVHAEIGMDEISPRGATAMWEVRDEQVVHWILDPASVGLAVEDLSDLAGGDPADNAGRIERLLCGEGGAAARAAALLNAGAALYVAGLGLTFANAVDAAEQALREGRAAAVLEGLRGSGDQSRAAPRGMSGPSPVRTSG